MKIKNHAIRPIDIKDGMFVFVAEWFDDKPKDAEPHYFGVEKPKKAVGQPFKVLAVAFPFITVEICGNGIRGVLDTREAAFMQCDIKWVRALLPHYGEAKMVERREPDKRLQYVAKDGGFWREVIEKRPGE